MQASLHHMTLSKVDTQATALSSGFIGPVWTCCGPPLTLSERLQFLPCCTMNHSQAVLKANYKPETGFKNHFSKPRGLR